MLDSCKMIFILVYDSTTKNLFSFVRLKKLLSTWAMTLVVLFSDTQGCCLIFFKTLKWFYVQNYMNFFIIFNNALSD